MNLKQKIFGTAWALLLLIGLCSMKCKKDGTTIDSLPPPTETGANTFGFMLDGKAWVPHGNPGGITNNLEIQVDLGKTGSMVISALRTDSRTNNRENIFIGIRKGLNSYDGPFTIDLSDKDIAWMHFSGSCDYYNKDFDVDVTGQLVVTKYDKDNKILAGMFHATIIKPSCETIKITEGRFDMKIGY